MKVCYIDFEMCDVPRTKRREYQYSREIIQIGAVKREPSGRVERFNSYVRPEYGRINQRVYDLTGIRGRNVASALVLRDLLPTFSQWLNGCDKIITWSNADRIQLETEMHMKHISNTDFNTDRYHWVDCQQLFSTELAKMTGHPMNRIFSLDRALLISDLDASGLHNAATDAECTMKIHSLLETAQFHPNVYLVNTYENRNSSFGNSLKDLLSSFSFNMSGEVAASAG